jgi:hypothetical protein
MSDLPVTTEKDLRKLGLTPEKLREKFESRGWEIKGTTYGFFLPEDRHWQKDSVRQARNDVRCDWTAVEEHPPKPVKQNVYDQSFENFGGDKPMDFNFNNTTTVTTGTDYSLVKSFDIGVNASIQMGKEGPMLGMNASMSKQDVQNKSVSTSVSHSVGFTVPCPAYAGRLVTETTTETSAETIYESKVGPTGTVCLAVRKPNMYYIFYHIEDIFPELYDVGRIICTTIDTQIETSIYNLDPPVSKGEKPRLGHGVSHLTHRTPRTPTHPKLGLHSILEESAAVLIPSHTHPKLGAYNGELSMRLQFSNVTNPVPVDKRVQLATQFRLRLTNDADVQHAVGVGQLPQWTYVPGGKPDYAMMTMWYDTEVVANMMTLAQTIRTIAMAVPWGGCNYRLTFE